MDATTTTTPDLHYLDLLAQQVPTIQAAATEIINLSANLQLPKGTEHFLSDIHGEFEAFDHVLRNASGAIKRRLDETFANQMTDGERRALATLIYYPEQKLSLMLETVADPDELYRITLFRLIRLCRVVSSKYTRAAVREALPADFAYVIEELLHEQEGILNRQEYYQSIVETIIEIGRARPFIVALAELIQRLAVARLHIIGDIYDRGPGAHRIVDKLMAYHAVDIQWGNHDIVWMGAAAGSDACIANVIRICLRYANMETLQDGYAISLLPLASFAVEVYANDPCHQFVPRETGGEAFTEGELRLMAQMHKAIAIIQLKLEGQLIARRPEFGMADRACLDRIDFAAGNCCHDGATIPLCDSHFPTVDPADPFALTPAEAALVRRLRLAFLNSEKLQAHIRFLFNAGSMYLITNGNLLYHGCIPMHPDGAFVTYEVDGAALSPRAYMDHMERLARQGFFADDPDRKQDGLDALWYLWSGARSPLFGKSRMATFERYFLADPATHREDKNPYYDWRDQEDTARRILAEFGLDPDAAHIINGHVPVRVTRGESPVKAGGRLLVIDGGFSRAYQAQTGIAGYTLIYNSYGLLLAAHEPFDSTQSAIEQEADIHSQTQILERNTERIRVRDTDRGRQIAARIVELKALLAAYRQGEIKQRER